ncbi:MAG: DUF166 family protein [Archaeoglobales archaeon]|nr:DUF166 family protein [Archaeoglobales archaeon]
MELLIFQNGFFAERFVANLMNYPNSCPSYGACGIDACTQCKAKIYSFTKNIVAVYSLPDPKTMPDFIENPKDFLPKKVAEADVAILINIHPDILASMPSYLEGKVSAVIVPTEEPSWCKAGLRKQISEKFLDLKIEFEAPKPFCSFKPSTKILKKFYEEFKVGYPEFEIDMEDGRIRSVRVLKSQPCGAAWYIAVKLRNKKFENMRELWSAISEAHHSFPCTASMEKDVEYGDTLLHVAGYIARHSVDKALKYTGDEEIPSNLTKVVFGGEA